MNQVTSEWSITCQCPISFATPPYCQHSTIGFLYCNRFAQIRCLRYESWGMHQPIQVHRIFFQSKQDYYEL